MLDLPEPSTEKLGSSPLTQVTFQLRHEHVTDVSQGRVGVAVHQRVASDAVLEEQSTQDLTFAPGPTGVQAITNQAVRGWRLRAKDDSWASLIMPDFFTVETTQYDEWAYFRDRVTSVANAVATEVRPTIEQRIGLRFINEIRHAEVQTIEDWRRFINPALLGLIADETLGGAIAAAQQLLQIDGGEGRVVVLRHAAVRSPERQPRWIYLLDCDCSIQRGQGFDVSSALDAAEGLHSLALQVFQYAITEDFLRELRGAS